jgi:hypothetical protein
VASGQLGIYKRRKSVRKINRATIVIAVALVVMVVGTIGVRAQQNATPKVKRGCTAATIKGAYGIQISGTRESAPGGPIESVVGVVVRNYDGRGQFSQVDNVKGSISGYVPDRQGFGTYQVNEDCSAVAQLQPGPGILLEERLVIVEDGNEIRSMTALPPPAMVMAVHKRIDVR